MTKSLWMLNSWQSTPTQEHNSVSALQNIQFPLNMRKFLDVASTTTAPVFYHPASPNTNEGEWELSKSRILRDIYLRPMYMYPFCITL